MVLAGRRRTIAFFIALGAGMISVILLLYIGWVLLNWRTGILFFSRCPPGSTRFFGCARSVAMSSMTPSSTPLRMNSRRRSHPYGCISKPCKPTRWTMPNAASSTARCWRIVTGLWHRSNRFCVPDPRPGQPEAQFPQRRTRGGGGGIGDARTRT
jgi:hypothetical protein